MAFLLHSRMAKITPTPNLDGDGEKTGSGDWALYPGSDAEAATRRGVNHYAVTV